MTRTAISLVALSLGLSGVQCGQEQVPVSTPAGDIHPEVPPERDLVRLAESSRDAAGIDVVKAESRPSKSLLRAMGKVLAPRPQTAIVGHAFPARIAAVHCKIGDWVEAGRPLVTLESHEVGLARSEFYKAVADLELAKVNLEREQKLLESGIGIKKNLLAAEAGHKIAELNAEAAEKRLHVLGFTEQEVGQIAATHQIHPSISLFAPIAGKVIATEAVLGALVDQSTEIVTIMDPTMLWVDAEIYEKDIAKVKAGQEVELGVPAYPGEVFGGKVTYLGDVVNEETRTMTVRAEVENKEHRLKPGMFADVAILLNGGCRMLVVPEAAILDDGREKIVFVEENDGCYRRRKIETGDLDGDCRQVLSGVEAGEKVVVKGNYQLYSKLKEEILHQAQHAH